MILLYKPILFPAGLEKIGPEAGKALFESGKIPAEGAQDSAGRLLFVI